jgi:hypothetical protein
VNNLIENYPKVNISFAELENYRITSSEPFVLTVEWEGVKFEFLIRYKLRSTHLLIMGSGAGALSSEKQVGPPVFQRHSWIDNLEDSVIYYNDPTLYHDSNLRLAWGQGVVDRFYLKDIAIILEKLRQKIGIPTKNVIYYGSSGGGFMSLILAGFMKGSTALVNSPQINLTNWLKVPVLKVYKWSYPGLTEQEVIERYSERIDVIAFYNSIRYVPCIYYLQNAYCEFDIVNQVTPFLEGLQKMNPDCVVNRVKLDFHYTVQPGPPTFPAIGGHGALGKAATLKYIQKVKYEINYSP